MSRTCQSVVSFTRCRCLALILRSAAVMIARIGYRVRGVLLSCVGQRGVFR